MVWAVVMAVATQRQATTATSTTEKESANNPPKVTTVKTSCRINVQSLIRIGTCLWLFEIGALLPVLRRILKEFSTNFLFKYLSSAISKSPFTHPAIKKMAYTHVFSGRFFENSIQDCSKTFIAFCRFYRLQYRNLKQSF